jgi:hypothetical protein
MEVSGQLHIPAILHPVITAPGTHWIGGWVGAGAGLDTVVKRKNSHFCLCRNRTLAFQKSDLAKIRAAPQNVLQI